MTSATRHLQLAIEVDSDPISGSVSNGTQRSEQFTGWIELVAAIEAARRSGHALGRCEEGQDGPAKHWGASLGRTAQGCS